MIFLAWRYLLARPRQTILTLLGIFFGTMAYISISGFLLGFRGFLVDQLVNNNAHVFIRAREDFLTEHSLDASFYPKALHIFWQPAPSGRKDADIVENPQAWYERLRADPRVVAFTPHLTAAVIFSNGKATVPTSITGCDPQQQKQVTTIGEDMIEGSFSDLAAGGNRVVVGSELQKKLGVRVLQNIWLAPAQGAAVPFKVVGVFKTGNLQADNLAYGNLADVQAVNRTLNQVNEIAVRLRDYNEAAAVANSWARVSQEKVESWDQVNASFFEVFRLQDAIRFLTIGAILIVAGFGIYNVLNMTAMQKRKDIAILRSLGFESQDVIFLFFYQGLILGAAGAALGVMAGYFISLGLQNVSFSGGPIGIGGGKLVIEMNPSIYLKAAAMALGASSFASLLPARSAGKLMPIEIIRAGE